MIDDGDTHSYTLQILGKGLLLGVGYGTAIATVYTGFVLLSLAPPGSAVLGILGAPVGALVGAFFGLVFAAPVALHVRRGTLTMQRVQSLRSHFLRFGFASVVMFLIWIALFETVAVDRATVGLVLALPAYLVSITGFILLPLFAQEHVIDRPPVGPPPRLWPYDA